MEDNFNVSSLVVMCVPERLEMLWDSINKIKGAECHYKDGSGKIIVTLESANISEEIKLLREIEKLEFVISAQMIYAYHKDELESARDEIANNGQIPEVLQNNAKAESINYIGDAQMLLDKIIK
ncbi:MAG: chaperone NapD [Helicobacter sp.]|nr:chaperone NapD [Helicobacteraceae bacterium]MDY3113929.1 chaperone NapD [Helicobacter sp.]